ncbi:MAG: hypothetical protein KDK37_09705, partial [Leptospiraceae bacterium]|nr:hypothetical protein [Leptospiraceae bacterium]
MPANEEKFLLKDHLFNKQKVQALAADIAAAYPKFPVQKFVKECVGGFKDRELKARISWMAELLRKHLPQNYRQATQILLESLPRPADPSLSDGDFGDFIYAPFNEFVAKYG